jgi:hypothetical protein
MCKIEDRNWLLNMYVFEKLSSCNTYISVGSAFLKIIICSFYILYVWPPMLYTYKCVTEWQASHKLCIFKEADASCLEGGN